MEQVPADEVEGFGRLWPVNCHRKIAATFCGTVVAKNFTWFQFVTLDLFCRSVH
jgi:hypothetical protein